MGRRIKADLSDLAATQNTNVPDMVEAYLKSVAAASEGVPIRHMAITGDEAAESLIAFVRGEDVRMVVMATHGRTGIERWRLGSVAERVVRHSEVPVLVIPTRRANAGYD